MHLQLDEFYMQRCLDLAYKSCSTVFPNPMVGCVIVHKGKIIGEGYHTKQGTPHAEVHAIESVKDKELLKDSTLYVNLEPCCHYGKTPPCVDMIIKHKIPRVVIGTLDINPCVKGKGIDKLKANSCHVTIGVLEKSCRDLNKRFFTYHEKKRPYIILKWAQTIDGFMDIAPEMKGKNKTYWISNDILKLKVHQWRAQENAIFVGANTIINDNPQLNVRYCAGNNPSRITFLKESLQPKHFHFFDGTQNSIVFSTFKNEDQNNLHYYLIKDIEHYLQEIMDKLYELQYLSILVEGGRKTLDALIQNNLWDEARILIGNKCFGKGLSAPVIPVLPSKTASYNEDKLLYIYNMQT